jgi:hypothetical protein
MVSRADRLERAAPGGGHGVRKMSLFEGTRESIVVGLR